LTQEPSELSLLTVIVTLAEALPHASVKICSPKSFITTVSLPNNDLSPVQAPEAVQEDALVLDHVIVVGSSTITVIGFADIDTVAGGGVVPPPSLELLEPPPQADNNKVNEISSATEDFKMLDIYTPFFRYNALHGCD
jgi:hypothetical protein